MDEIKKRITQLREDFMLGSLSEKEVSDAPSQQFELWLNQAMTAELPEWQAMTLGTVSPDLRPSTRIVYLRQFQNDQYWFYGNYNSRKAQHLKQNPNACLSFFWPQLERQIRLEGSVELCHDSTSDAYFDGRPFESKLGAWASSQSAVLKNREELEAQLEVYRKKFEDGNIYRPPYWGGWVFTANYYEFWQGRKSRLHDRITYENKNGQWTINRIAP